MRKRDKGCVIPRHKELAVGTLKSALRQAGISTEAFVEVRRIGGSKLDGLQSPPIAGDNISKRNGVKRSEVDLTDKFKTWPLTSFSDDIFIMAGDIGVNKQARKST